MSYAIVFPGQGSQEAGMGRDLYDNCAAARSVFDEADDALGFALSDIIFNGPDEELTKTVNAQPALLVTSIAALAAARDAGIAITPAFYAGHSLGEYTALAASSVLPLTDAVKLVRERGRLMQNAVPLGLGAMSAVIGLDADALLKICDEARGEEVCAPANVNAPGQVVISGDAGAVARAGKLASERGAKKVIPLKVSAPFHCTLMRPVADALAEEFGKLSWSDPNIPIVANADAKPKKSADDIKSALFAQTFSPVLWEDCVNVMVGAGVAGFAEFGPGSVLSGLIKRIAKGVKTVSAGKMADMSKLAEAMEGFVPGGLAQ
ncbi:malonyl CoA-acyl carrier protein transacylase [Synergistales bacterium]|nr:malonyl CoA-acyl carrier protein transacylase [Synergistales bacterium]